MFQSPQSFIVGQECDKAAFDNGFRCTHGETDGWRCYGSTTAQGLIWLAAAGSDGPWYLVLEHAGVIAELDLPPADMAGPGLVRFGFDSLGALYEAMPRIYQLSVSLPEAPLDTFREKVKNLPQKTEAERLVVQRIGQDIFRSSLMEYKGVARLPALRSLNCCAPVTSSHGKIASQMPSCSMCITDCCFQHCGTPPLTGGW